MIHVLQTIFLEDAINKLQDKYKHLIPNKKEKLYTYANIYSVPLYYKLFTFKNNPDYGLYDKLLNKDIYEVINLSIKTIQENNYNQNQILLLYSYICNIIFTYYIDEYILYKSKYNKRITRKSKMNKFSKTAKIIEAQFYEERFYTNINKYSIDIEKLAIDDESLRLLDEIFSVKYLMSYGINVLEKGLENFKLYQRKNYNGLRFVNKLIAKILDMFTRSKKYSASSIFNLSFQTNKDYLNKENNIWHNKHNETTQSFYELYDEALNFAANFLTIISEKIYYQVKNDGLIFQQISLIKTNKE